MILGAKGLDRCDEAEDLEMGRAACIIWVAQPVCLLPRITPRYIKQVEETLSPSRVIYYSPHLSRHPLEYTSPLNSPSFSSQDAAFLQPDNPWRPLVSEVLLPCTKQRSELLCVSACGLSTFAYTAFFFTVSYLFPVFQPLIPQRKKKWTCFYLDNDEP